MLKILLCEDNKIQREKLKDIIEKIVVIENLDMKVQLSTDNPHQILNFIDENKEWPYIYFLDVDLKNDINGIELSSKIREMDPLGYIVFITTHSEMSFLTFKYKVEALDYILKDNYANIEKSIKDCLKLCHDKYYEQVLEEKVLTIEHDDMLANIPYKNILFIETSINSHKIIIHEENRQIEVPGSISDIEENLDDDFYRCHRAYLVNIKKIDRIDKKQRIIYMDNGETCLASSRAIGGLLNAYNI